MKIQAGELLNELAEDTRELISSAKKHFGGLSEEQFLLRPAPGRWSPAECLEHLNLYADYYHPVIRKAMAEVGPFKTDYIFKSGFAGNYFANSMRPGKGMKLSTPANKNPLKVGMEEQVLKRFLQYQKDMLDLLTIAGKRDLNGIKIPLSITSLIKFRLGDTFRFVVYHNQRHVVQAVRSIGEF